MGQIQEVCDKSLSIIKDIMQGGMPLEEQRTICALYDQLNADILLHKQELQEVYDSLCDENSKEQFLNFLSFRLIRKINYNLGLKSNHNMTSEKFQQIASKTHELATQKGLVLPQLKFKGATSATIFNAIVSVFGIEQYVYPGCVELGKEDVFIDCGPFLGDTVIWATQKGAQVHAFEPIDSTFVVLQENLKINGVTNAHCYNLGISDQDKDMIFKLPTDHADSAFSSEVQMSSYQIGLEKKIGVVDVPVKCVSLDSWLTANNVTPTFIKMDIEGAELSALHGATQTITKLKPKLAICLYHNDSDLWTIPLFIHSIVPEYKFYCRENAVGYEFVLYATVE